MKTLRLLAVFIGLCCLSGIAQAPNINCSIVQGFGLGCSAGNQIYASYTTEYASIVDPNTGRATGFLPGLMVVAGQGGVTTSVQFLKPNGTIGTLTISGGIIVGAQ